MNPSSLALSILLAASPVLAQDFSLDEGGAPATVEAATGDASPSGGGAAAAGQDGVLKCIAADRSARQGLTLSADNLARCLFMCPNPGGAKACGVKPDGSRDSGNSGEFSHPPIKLACMAYLSNDAAGLTRELIIGNKIYNQNCKPEWGFFSRILLGRAAFEKGASHLAKIGLRASRGTQIKDEETAKYVVKALDNPDAEIRLEALFQLVRQYGVSQAPMDKLLQLTRDLATPKGEDWLNATLWPSSPPVYKISALASEAVSKKAKQDYKGNQCGLLTSLTQQLGRVARPDDPLLAGEQGPGLPDEIRIEALRKLGELVSDSSDGLSIYPRLLSQGCRLDLAAFLMRQKGDPNADYVKKAAGIYGRLLQIDDLRRPLPGDRTIEGNIRTSMIGEMDDLRKKGVNVAGFPINGYFGPR